jgi:MFS family permease
VNLCYSTSPRRSFLKASEPGPQTLPPTRPLWWHFVLSAYWFSVSLKWFVLLTVVLSLQVKRLVPGGEKGTYWGTVVLVGALWAMIGPAFFGYLSDKARARSISWKFFVGGGSLLTVLALFILATAQSFPTIVGGYLLLQVADDVAQGPYSALIPALVRVEERGLASGVLGLLRLFAQIVGALGAMLLGRLEGGITWIYLFIGGITLGGALITVFGIREAGYTKPPAKTSFASAWVEPWKDSDFRLMWFTRFLVALGFYLVYNYLFYFLRDVVREIEFFGFSLAPIPEGLSPSERERALEASAMTGTLLIALVISVVGGISAVYFGKRADVVGRKRVVYLAGVIMALPMVPFILFPNYTLILFLAVVFGIGYGAYESATWALASDVMPDRKTLGKDMGLWQSSISAPQIFSGLAGRMVDFGNRYQMGFGYTYTFLLAGVAFGMGTWLVRRIRGST